MNSKPAGKERVNDEVLRSPGGRSISKENSLDGAQHIKSTIKLGGFDDTHYSNQNQQPLISIDDQQNQSINVQRLPCSYRQLNFNQGTGEAATSQREIIPGQLYVKNQIGEEFFNVNLENSDPSQMIQGQDPQVIASYRTQRSQQEVWRVSNINEDLVYDDGEESSLEDDDKQQKKQLQKSIDLGNASQQAAAQNMLFQNALEEDYDQLEERVLTEATPSRTDEGGETDRYQQMCFDSQRNQLLSYTDGTKSNDRFNYEETQEDNNSDEDEGNGRGGEGNGEPDFHFDTNNSYQQRNGVNSGCHRLSRSKTAEDDINAKNKSVIPGLNLKNKNNDDFVATVDSRNMRDNGGRHNKYLEDDVISGVLETKKYRISSQQTLQTEGDNLVNHYTTQSALNTERQSSKSVKVNSSIFGSLNLSALRSARQIFPRAFSNLGNKDDPQLSSRSKNSNLKHYPEIPQLQFKQNCKQMLQRYKRSCMEGIFLKHIFCEAVPLKWYIIFMMALDLFMAIADSLSIYTRGQGILQASTQSERIAMTIGVVFFALRVFLYIPTCYYSLKLYMYDSRTGGKVLYSLKLATFVLYILFNLIAVGFIMKDGCTSIHIKLPKMNSFQNQVNNDDGSVGDPENLYMCRFSTQIVEVVGLSFYYFLSCWIILSILYWVRRSKKDPSSEFLNLISGANFISRNPISQNHYKSRPLVKESQIQQKNNKKKLNMPSYQLQDESQITEQVDDTPVRLTSAVKSIHVNLKVAMKNLQDYRTDSQKNRIQKNKPGSATSSQKTRNPPSTRSSVRAKK